MQVGGEGGEYQTPIGGQLHDTRYLRSGEMGEEGGLGVHDQKTVDWTVCNLTTLILTV